MILITYLTISIIALILYHFTKYGKQVPEYWKGGSSTRLAFYYLLRSVVFLIVWPGVVAHLVFPPFRPIFEIQYKYKRWKQSRHLYFEMCSGGGIMECKECGYEEKIIASVHHQADCDYRLGYQCQKCGKHIAIADPFKYKKLPNCECGGKLSKEKPLFCGQCGSKDVEYYRTYLT